MISQYCGPTGRIGSAFCCRPNDVAIRGLAWPRRRRTRRAGVGSRRQCYSQNLPPLKNRIGMNIDRIINLLMNNMVPCEQNSWQPYFGLTCNFGDSTSRCCKLRRSFHCFVVMAQAHRKWKAATVVHAQVMLVAACGSTLWGVVNAQLCPSYARNCNPSATSISSCPSGYMPADRCATPLIHSVSAKRVRVRLS